MSLCRCQGTATGSWQESSSGLCWGSRKGAGWGAPELGELQLTSPAPAVAWTLGGWLERRLGVSQRAFELSYVGHMGQIKSTKNNPQNSLSGKGKGKVFNVNRGAENRQAAWEK